MYTMVMACNDTFDSSVVPVFYSVVEFIHVTSVLFCASVVCCVAGHLALHFLSLKIY